MKVSKYILSIVVCFGFFALFSPIDRAEAYSPGTFACNSATHNWKFGNVPPGSEQKQGWVRNSFKTIEHELNHNGSKFVTTTETPSGNLTVNIIPLPDGLLGFATCVGSPRIDIHADFSASTFYFAIARHEMLHLSGQNHAGRYDNNSHGNHPATMSTCLHNSLLVAPNVLGQDEAAHLNWNRNTLQFRQLHANVGFERTTTYWAAVNGSISPIAQGGATGPRYVSFTATGTQFNSYIHQSSRVWVGGSYGPDYRAAMSVKRNSNSASGQASVRLYRATLTDGPTACTYLGFPPYPHVNNPNTQGLSIGGFMLVAETPTQAVGTSWVTRTSPWVLPPYADGYQFQIRAYGKAFNGDGSTSSIHFDNVRGEQ